MILKVIWHDQVIYWPICLSYITILAITNFVKLLVVLA